MSFCLPTAIKEYIDIRDARWRALKDRHTRGLTISPGDIEFLRTANNCASQMVTLTPGPSTPVLDAGRAKCEQLLCTICSIFILRLEAEIRAARKGAPPPRPKDVATLEEILPNPHAQ